MANSAPSDPGGVSFPPLPRMLNMQYSGGSSAPRPFVSVSEREMARTITASKPTPRPRLESDCIAWGTPPDDISLDSSGALRPGARAPGKRCRGEPPRPTVHGVGRAQPPEGAAAGVRVRAKRMSDSADRSICGGARVARETVGAKRLFFGRPADFACPLGTLRPLSRYPRSGAAAGGRRAGQLTERALPLSQ